LAWDGGQALLRATRDEFEEQLVQLGHHPGVVLTERAATVDQDPQQGEPLVIDHWTQPGHAGADQRDAVGVGGISLAALTGREHPRPGGQLRRDVDDRFGSAYASRRGNPSP
jgi:hypothetical protein